MGGGPHRPGLSPLREAVEPKDVPAIVIAGPTASGKSALAVAIAREFDGVVINADSMQVYRELSVLTARPGPAALAAAPHYLYGVLTASERCSAGRWRKLAEAATSEIDGRLPVFVGGTGLYLRVLVEGIAEIPQIAASISAEGAGRLAAIGGRGLHLELQRIDPVMAERLKPGDGQRVLRAWSVVKATGRSLAEWQANRMHQESRPSRIFALMPGRTDLYAACDARFVQMVENGALEEVKALLALGLDPSLPAMRAVGVRELGAAIAGRQSLAQAIAAAQQATRRYAKRQTTWIRHQMPSARVLHEQYSESILPEIFNNIRQFLLTART
jgi:tRNA dimethylallyltransferase